MNHTYASAIAGLLNVSLWQVENTLALFNEGATIPFISRYRKERTGSLDEEQVARVRDEYHKMDELEKRRETILSSIQEQGKLTDEVKAKIQAADKMSTLEDIYLPYKPKRKTKGDKAREKGLEPLAKILMAQRENQPDERALDFLNQEVASVEEALQGARDIIADWVNEHAYMRQRMRRLYQQKAVLTSRMARGKEEEGQKYKDYFEWEEPLKRCPSHRLLAMLRGEKEGLLRLSIAPEKEEALAILEPLFVKGTTASSKEVQKAVEDSYKRLISSSMESETKAEAKERADEEAIRVFALNMKQLLLSPPLGQHRVLAIDPGYRTGCKVVCLDKQGQLLHNETIFPHPPQREAKQAMKKITSLIDAYTIEAIAIGNGTASRETEQLIRRMRFNKDVSVFVVSEDGASVYSASKVAREEFPDYDVTVRGAVSIGRRLMDPLAELVKIDPKSIGVGQYQHDVDQTRLKQKLDEVVESAVNAVGVNVNTASKHLLTYVSGLGPTLAANVVAYRHEQGPFRSRKELKKVKRMGEKAFQQSAGFLRVEPADNPLDNSAVHPESYAIVQQMARDLACTVEELMKQRELREKIQLSAYVTEEIGMPTLQDIMKELEKPGRDPRQQIEVFQFADNVSSIEDLREGMVLPGLVTNITNFGAFVDIGVKQDGLVHISQLANRFVSDPNEVVRLNQQVQVKVVEVDTSRKRIQLSMKEVE
ncbi:MAG: Tex family protein [Bacteroidales bacterium]